MKKAIKMLSVILALLMCMTVVLAACNNDDDPDGVQVIISRPEANIEVGEELSLSAVASDGTSVTWSSSNSAVATVSSSGLVVGVSVGSAIITATAGEVSATCSVTVRAAGQRVDKLPKTYSSDGKDYTYNDYLTVTPSNWNELDYADANDTAILGYIGSPFFEYDYKFDGGKFNPDGSINFDGIVEGSFEVKYSAATALEDVTDVYGEDWDLTDDQIAAGGYIWKITLRHDLAWNDGTPIYAEDFVYTMQQQLDPQFQLRRADTWYNNAVKIHNAQNYVYQGQSGWFSSRSAYGIYSADLDSNLIFTLGNASENADYGNAICYMRSAMGVPDSYTSAMVVSYLNASAGAGLNADLIVQMTGKTLAEIKADPTLNAEWTKLLGWWQTEPNEELDFFVTDYTFPAVNFANVGIFNDGDWDIILVLDQPQEYFKEDGSLSYLAAYNFGSLPLVKKDLYESCKKAPQSGSTLWTTTYNTSLDTTASWGPYMLTQFQAGRQFTLGRNEYWYGYALDEYKGQYLTDQIITQVIADEQAARLAFWAGEIDGLGIDVTIADNYRNSDYAVYTPGSGTFGIQLYGNLDVLKNSGRNNGILAIKEFRGALSLALDRADYNSTVFTSHQPCLGVMGPAYYYDVENGLTYRGSQQAKEALLRVYGFSLNDQNKWTDGQEVYSDLDEAYDAMTGYNLTKAREWLEEAYTELTTHADTYGYNPAQNIVIKFGTEVDNASTRRQYNYFVTWLANLVQGTSLEGKIELIFDSSFGDAWSDAFMDGEYEFAAATGFQGAVFDPFYIIGSNLNIGSLTYHPYWATDEEELTIKLPDGDYEQAGQELTLTITQWYHSLNGNTSEADFLYNWGPGSGTPAEVRLQILAALEEYALGNYYFVPTTSQYSAALHSAKWSYASDTYNTMMGFGGIQYQQYNYTDAEWIKFVADHDGDLQEFYKQAS